MLLHYAKPLDNDPFKKVLKTKSDSKIFHQVEAHSEITLVQTHSGMFTMGWIETELHTSRL